LRLPPAHWLTVGGVVLGYAVLALIVLSPDVVSSGDSGVKFVQARALLDNRFRSLAIPYRGAFVDPQATFTPLRPPFVLSTASGETQAIFPPAGAVLQAMFVGFGGVAGLRLLSILGAAVALWSAVQLAGRHSAWLPIALGLGTPLWFYAVTESEHTPAVACGAAAFALGAWGHTGSAALAGALLGAGAALRDECVLLLPGLLVGIWWKTRSFKAASAAIGGCAGVLLVAAAIEVWWFGRPVAAHLQHAVHFARSALHLTAQPNPELPTLAPMTLYDRYQTIVEYWLIGAESTPAMLVLLVGTIAAALLAWRGTRRPLIVAVVVLTALAVVDAVTLANAPRFNAGLYRLSPFLLFAILPGAAGSDDDRWLNRVVLLTLISYLLLAWFGVDTTGGKALGPRLLLPLVPLLAASAFVTIRGYFMSSVRLDRILGVCGIALASASVVMQTAGTMPAWTRRVREDAERLAAITASDQRILVADDMFTAQQLLPLYYRRIVLLADGFDRGSELGAVLEQQRVPSVLVVSRRVTPHTELPPLKAVWTSRQYRYLIQIWRR
jgi:hypothetical protein